MIAEANESTLFLDEISDMPADLQTRFLRVLQEREFRPLGSTRTLKRISLDCGNESANCAGARREPLRSDLYYRLNTFQIESSAVTRTEAGHPPLVTFFVKQFAQQLGKS